MTATPENLFSDNLALAAFWARRYVIPGQDFEDRFQEALLCLNKAACTFDQARGAKFSTYASHLIRNRVHNLWSFEGRRIQGV